MPPFAKILIANRGEIAMRVSRTAHSLGYRTVAVYSDADCDSPHVAACDEAVRIGPAPAAQSYLSIETIVDAALRTGADAVHPGYGFLSERAEFADACLRAGLVFIGPPADAMRAMGDKIAAKERMIAAGVPCIASFSGEQTEAAFERASEEIGYPVMLKASAGGGGKGMRVVRSREELPGAFEATQLEAERAFGSRMLLVEKALESARHVEIQIFADNHGSIVHLGERDCSIQRRHQKVVEEAPAPGVSAVLRESMGTAAIAVARAVGYSGAGTVEFLLDDDGAFYFLEMNTRLQVEHAVTEAVRGIDLVAWQIRVAAGARLDEFTSTAAPAGHAIEVRLYAEDPGGGFLPQAGTVVTWRPPHGDGIRVDAALADGLAVSPYYDPMLAKIVASGTDRNEARRRLIRALEETSLFGIATNRSFLIACLEHPVFARGDAHTNFIANNEPALQAASESPELTSALGAALFFMRSSPGRDPAWQSREGGTSPVKLRCGETTIAATAGYVERRQLRVLIGTVAYELDIEPSGERVRYTSDGITRSARATFDGDVLYVQTGRTSRTFTDVTFAPSAARAAATRGAATAPMPGIVAKVAVAVGDAVVLGQTIVVLEAMKMMHEISAGATGRVARVMVAPGQQVGMRALLVDIEALEPA